MAHYKISLAFAKLPDDELCGFAVNVITQMTDNPAFVNPRVPLTELTAAKDTFLADLVASLDGGRVATARKNASRRKLIDLLRTQAIYVQSIAGADLALLLTSGFLAASTNRSPMLLPRAVIKHVTTPLSTKFKVAVKPVRSARGYEARCKAENGEYIYATFSTSSRNLVLENLILGTAYAVEARAVGGLRGYGEWSDPSVRIAV